MKKKNSEKTRINLLPAKDRSRIAKSRKRLVIFFLITGYLIFIALLDLTFVLNNNYKKTELSRLNQRLTVLKTKNILNKTFSFFIIKVNIPDI